MAGKHRRQSQKSMWENPAAKVLLVVFAVFMVFSLVIYANEVLFKLDFIPTSDDILYWLGGKNSSVTVAEGNIAVHFIDVEQGDCELIVSGDTTVLVDCGEKIHSSRVIEYLKDQGIRKLDYIIATHPHEDHIGGMSDIMQSFAVGKVIMPEVPADLLPMGRNFEKMLDTIESRGIDAEYCRQGAKLDIGNGAEIEFIAPVHDDYTNLNNYSIVFRLVHGNRSFLFTGDVERAAESDILNSGQYLDSDVLKVGHHGSTTSSTPTFIEAVSPEYAVIEVGEGNSYGHPKAEVVNRLLSYDCTIYTTMTNGNIVFVSDGENLTIHADKDISEYRPATEDAA